MLRFTIDYKATKGKDKGFKTKHIYAPSMDEAIRRIHDEGGEIINVRNTTTCKSDYQNWFLEVQDDGGFFDSVMSDMLQELYFDDDRIFHPEKEVKAADVVDMFKNNMRIAGLDPESYQDAMQEEYIERENAR